VKAVLDLRSAARQHRPELPELPELRVAALGTWRGRMINEYQSAEVFGALAQQAEHLGLAAKLVSQLGEFEAEERKHGVLCGGVVEALGGEARAAVSVPRRLPEHAGTAPLERLEMPEGALRDVLSEIWADEVGHARFGWRVAQELLPQLDAAARGRLSLYLRVALRHLEVHELAHLPLASTPPAAGVALGLCSGADARVLFYETVSNAILPALEGLGLAANDAWAARASADALLAPLTAAQ
jgi:hypothetical protein